MKKPNEVVIFDSFRIQPTESEKTEIERLKKEFFEIGKNVFADVTTPEEVIYKMQTEPSMRFESKEQMLQMA